MKIKHLLALAALAVGSSAWAQTDVTESYIGDIAKIVGTNGNCKNDHKKEQGIGWYNTQAVTPNAWHAFVPIAENTGLESWTAAHLPAGVMMGRTMVLPEGKYKLTFEAFGTTAGNATENTKVATGVVAFCGTEEIDCTNKTIGDATFKTCEFNINVTEPNTVYEFGVKLKEDYGADWAQLKNVKLEMISEDIIPVANNTIDGWTQVFTGGDKGALACNTWSTEGQSDGSNFMVPFNQIWVGRGTPLSNQTVTKSYTPTKDGIYKVSAWVRAYNEVGGEIKGAKIFVNDVESDACGGASIPNGVIGTYTAMADGVTGTPIEYGIKIEDAQINWISFKNFTITYVGASLPEADKTALLATVPTGKMNATIQTNLDNYVTELETKGSVAAYNTLASYITTAQASINTYSAIKNMIDNNKTIVSGFDATGQATYDVSIIETAYANGTITDGESEIASLKNALKAASKAQTTPGSDMTQGIYSATTSTEGWNRETEDLTFQWDTWAGTASGMATPFIEYWIASSATNKLSTNKIYQTITGLHAGVYRLSMETAVNNENTKATPEGISMYAGTESTTLCSGTATSFNGFTGVHSLEFVVSAPSEDVEIGIELNEPNINWLAFKNVKLTYVCSNEIDVTISDAGYATFVTPYALDFTGNAIEAYAISEITSGSAKLTKLTQVPAGEAIVVKGTTGTVPAIASAASITNLLTYSATDVDVDGTQYILAKVNVEGVNKVGFAKATTGTIAAGKGFFVSSAPIKSFAIEIEEEDVPLAIQSVSTTSSNAAYNLAGQRVAPTQKGIVIINGKKIFNK